VTASLPPYAVDSRSFYLRCCAFPATRPRLKETRIRHNEEKGTPMTITLEIRPEIEAELSRQAAAHGIGIDAYVASLLEEAAHASSVNPPPQTAPKDMVELFAPLRGLDMNFERDRDMGRDIQL